MTASPQGEETKLREALEKCRDKFRKYAELHWDKGTADGNEKAARNAEMAEMCEQALSTPSFLPIAPESSNLRDKLGPQYRREWDKAAHAAVIAPDHVLVPREPTGAMFSAAWGHGVSKSLLSRIYREMLTAAPQPPSPRQGTPIAWVYELATRKGPEGYAGWEDKLSWFKPSVPEGSIRRLRALYPAPASPRQGEGKFKPCVGCEMPRTCTAVSHCYAAPPPSGEAEAVVRASPAARDLIDGGFAAGLEAAAQYLDSIALRELAREVRTLSPNANGGDHG